MSRQRLIINVGSSFVQTVITSLSLFILYRVLLESIGAEGLGIWSLIIAFSSTVQMANFGIGGSLTKSIADYSARKDYTAIGELIHTSAISVIFFTTVFVVVTYPLANYFLQYALSGPSLHEARDLLPIAVAAFWLLTLTSTYTSALLALQKLAERNVIIIAESLIYLLISAMVAPRYGLMGLAYARLGQNILTLVVTAMVVSRSVSGLTLLPRKWKGTRLREMLNYAVGFQMVSILVAISDPIVKLALGRFGSVTLVGYYEMANKLVQQLRGLLVNMNQVLVPMFAERSLIDEQRVKTLYFDSYRIMLLACWPIFSTLVVASPAVSWLWLGVINLDFVRSLCILSTGWCINTITVPAYFAAFGIGAVWTNVFVHVVITLSTVMLSFVLGPLGGLWVIVAANFGLCLGAVTQYLLFHRLQHVPLIEIVPAPSRVLVALGFIVAIGGGSMYFLWDPSKLWSWHVSGHQIGLHWFWVVLLVGSLLNGLAIVTDPTSARLGQLLQPMSGFFGNWLKRMTP